MIKFRDYALIIGINHYTPGIEDLGNLEAAIPDAKDFEEWFRNESGDGEKICEPVHSTSHRISPDFREIEKAVDRLIKVAKKDVERNRRLYFYFAGHGFAVQMDRDDNALVLASWSPDKSNNALSYRQYKNVFMDFGLFRQVIVLLDCCRKPKYEVIPQGSRQTPNKKKPVFHRSETFIGFATEHGNLAYEVDVGKEEKRGAFTSVLLEGLRGGAKDRNGKIYSERLKNYLIKNTPKMAKDKRFVQKPEVLNGLTMADAVLAEVAVRKIVCRLKIAKHHIGVLTLTDDLGEVIGEWMNEGGHTLTLPLVAGTYYIKDTLSGEYVEILIDDEGIDPVDIKFE